MKMGVPRASLTRIHGELMKIMIMIIGPGPGQSRDVLVRVTEW